MKIVEKVLFALVVMPLILTACASATPSSSEAVIVAPATDSPTAASSVAVPATAETVQVQEDFVPTDPATVNLAAGKPQLVEFFAFW